MQQIDGDECNNNGDDDITIDDGDKSITNGPITANAFIDDCAESV